MAWQGGVLVALTTLPLLMAFAAAGDVAEAPPQAALLADHPRLHKSHHRQETHRADDDDDVADPSSLHLHGRRALNSKDEGRLYFDKAGRLRAHARAHEEPEEDHEEPEEDHEDDHHEEDHEEDHDEDHEHDHHEKEHKEDHDEEDHDEEDEDFDFEHDEEQMKRELAGLEDVPSPAAAGPAAALTPEQEQALLREQIRQAEAIQHLAKGVDALDDKVKIVRKDVAKVKKKLSAAAGHGALWLAVVAPCMCSLLLGWGEGRQ